VSGEATRIRGLDGGRFVSRRLVSSHRGEQGYILLTLLLLVALMVIAAGVASADLAFEIKRDREEELIHRGVQYSRAIKRFTKKNGRFPLTLEQLKGDSDIRYIRKLYKDPVTGKDFRLLHMGDIPSASGAPNLNSGAPNANAAAADNSGDPNAAASSDSNTAAGNGSLPGAQTPGSQVSGSQASGLQTIGSQLSPQTPSQGRGLSQGSNGDNSTFGGQVIFGVASSSKKPTIREFYHKNHYNDWLFFYDPNYDRGTEIKGPTSLIPVANQLGNNPNQPQPQNSQLPQNSQPQQNPPQGSQPQ
jgi:hypothetical protein